MTLLKLENINLHIDSSHILRNINLSIDQGESVGLVGESGSGKSITSLAAMRLLPANAMVSGTIRFEDKNLSDLSERQMCRIRGRKMAMIFQEPMTALNPVKTIGEQVAEGIQLHLGLSRANAYKKVLQLLDRVGLPSAQFSPGLYPHEMSGGQRQRVVIAIALALNPRLLIADEPTTALDVTTQAKILNLLKELAAENESSLFLITHDLAVVAQMVDRIVVMKEGEIVERGPTLSFFRSMRHPYAKKLLAASVVKSKPEKPERILKNNKPLLRVDSLVRQYRLPRTSLFRATRFFKAVNNVSFDINPGESVGLVGESGCGKSTLARTLLALNTPSGGTVEFLGKNLFTLSRSGLRDIRRNMQVIFQDPYGSFNPRHKIGRLISEPMQLLVDVCTSEKKRLVMQALLDVGLSPDDADRYPHEFSGGQRQRIAVARAIITQPKLIVADEPVSALDVSIREQILELLNDLAIRRGLSYLFISHDLHVVRAVTDRVLVMYQGKIVEQGPTDQIFDKPNHSYTKQLLQATPDLSATLNKLEAQAVNL